VWPFRLNPAGDDRGYRSARQGRWPGSRRIACRFLPGAEPALVFLPGYMSDMAGGKAQAVLAWAREAGRACLLLDYSGCGESEGDFADGTLSRWRDEVVALVRAHAIGRAVVIGSSMGGWLMLLVAGRCRARSRRWSASPPRRTSPTGDTMPRRRRSWRRGARCSRTTLWPRPHADHPAFWADGQARRMLDGTIAFDGAVRLLHGQRDPDVPWSFR
jgi:pimeloyl-ACP methyl ester carboxylesterase